ncbi:kinase-like domain-containing protein [Lactarius quietus]|nr:kinase-like domain-containing protein [Lactarius quietus]
MPPIPQHKPSLADLSRNASVLSSSSSYSSTSSLVLPEPRRSTDHRRPRASRPPAYITRELGIAEQPLDSPANRSPANSKSKSRSRSANGRLSTDDFEFGDILGEGSYSTVMHSTHRATSQEYAIKVLDNGHLKRDNKLNTAIAEKNSLVRLGSGPLGIVPTYRDCSPLALAEDFFIADRVARGLPPRFPHLPWVVAAVLIPYVSLGNMPCSAANGNPIAMIRAKTESSCRFGAMRFTFRKVSADSHFVLDLARNGELQSRISRMASLSTTCARYYTAQLVDFLDYMHLRGIIHRDLKPENLLLNDDFRIKVTDFGAGKLIDAPPERVTKAFVGAAQYISPEFLEANETSNSSDLWALGCVYQMIADQAAGLHLPEGFDPEVADLVRRLQARDPLERLGSGLASTYPMEELRAHPFFAPIRWDTLWDDPAPPLETGLIRRESGPADEWDDVGATWDEPMMEARRAHMRIRTRVDEHGEDGIEWAPDAQTYLSPLAIPPEEIGPHEEIPEYAREVVPLIGAINGVDAVDGTMSAGREVEDARGEHTFSLPGIDRVSKNTGPGAGAIADSAANDEATGSGVRPGPDNGPGPSLGKEKDEEGASPVGSSTEVGDSMGAAALGEEPYQSSALLRVPRVVQDSYATSSSYGIPVEKLRAALEAMRIQRGHCARAAQRPRATLPRPHPSRRQTGTPLTLPFPQVQAHHSLVVQGIGAGHRREDIVPRARRGNGAETAHVASPAAVACGAAQAKVRELALTNHRLLCFKLLKNGRGVGMKAEFWLREAQAPATGHEMRAEGGARDGHRRRAQER